MSVRTMRVAAVQPQLAFGEVDANLKRVADLARSAAAEHHPELLLLPEGMTSPNVYHPSMKAVARPIAGEPYQLLKALARELDCTVAGGYIAVRGRDAYHAYVYVDPDGTTNIHEKDQPTLWENNYYRPGRDDGLFTWKDLTLGSSMGMEWHRCRTARRLRGRVDLVAAGSCWWSFPDWPGVRRWFGRDHQYAANIAREMPARMARAVGAPVVIASHVGQVTSRTPLFPGIPWPTVMVGETQIVAADGHVLQRMTFDDGEGHIGQEIAVGAVAPVDRIPGGFWMAPVTASVHAIWQLQNNHGRVRYKLDHDAGRFPWQAWPADDMPNHIRGDAATAPTASERREPAAAVS